MSHGNPEVCEVRRQSFLMEVRLFASSDRNGSGFNLLGESIILSKPVVRQLSSDLNTIPFRNVIVPIMGKEYSARVSISKEVNRYKIMDNERTVLLGYINERTLHDFVE